MTTLIPQSTAPQSAFRNPQSTTPQSAFRNPQSVVPVSVLIVDDNPAKLAALSAALGGMGIDIVMAQSGMEALQQLLAQEFAAVLLDVNMPVMDGFETAKMIRSRPRSEHLPILFITAERLADEARLHGYELGAVDYITSPILPQILRSKVAVFADLYSLRKLSDRNSEELLRKNEEIAQQNLRLEQSSRMKSEFITNMSHELRTPMNSILGMAHLALNDESNPEKNRDYLNKIQASGEHLLGIIDDILDFSKLSSGKLKIDRIDFDLLKVMDTVKTLITGKAEEKGLKLVFDVDATLATHLRGDPLRLVQVLVNYASNAVKFTETGSVTVRVRKIEENETSTLVNFEVQDTGIGINAAGIAQLFQPFQQLDTSLTRRHEGTGIGLAICRQLAEMLPDGKTGVKSVSGRGSTFWFRVRLDKADRSGDKNGEAATNKEPVMPAAICGARILLAENNRFNQQVATDFLENAGATVCVAQNGKEAIDLLGKGNFDCVLMDIQMPVMDGFEATRLIRANPDTAQIPVIAMTASASDENRARCLAAGMNDFIAKPFTPYELCGAIAKWMGKQTPHCPPDNTTVLDLSVLAALDAGNRPKMHEFALLFLATVRQDMLEVDLALTRADHAHLATLGHHIRGAARMVGATALVELCRTLERYGKDGGSTEQIGCVVSQMHLMLDRLNEKVQMEFGSVKCE